MLLRRAPGIVAALLLLPLTILASVRLDTTVMVCRMTGAVTTAPCAPGDDTPPPAHDALVDPSCCDFVTIADARAPAETVACPELPGPVPAAGAIHAHHVSGLTPTRGPSLQVGAPPGVGPPIRQRTQTFLI